MPHVRSSEIKTYYEIQGEGEPLVLIPGLMGDIYTWTSPGAQSFFQELKDHFQVIMYDPRCAGKSGCPDTNFEFQTFVEDLKELLEYLEVDKVHLYGVSMGSRIAINFVLTYPEMVNKVILACGTPSDDYMTKEGRQLLLNLFKTDSYQDEVMKIYKFLLPPQVFEKQESMIEQTLSQPRSYPIPDPRSVHLQLEAALNTPHNTEELKGLDHEFLILKPGYDPLIDPSASDKLNEIIPNSRLIEYKNSIHEVLPPIQNPEMEPLISFLKGSQ